MQLRGLATLALLAALAVPLAACGGGSAVSADLSQVAQAATRTENAGSARFQLSVDASGLPTAASASLGAEGAVDYAHDRVRMTFDLSQVGNLFGTGPAGSTGTSMELLLDGKVMYLRFPLLAELLGKGKPWLKLDLERAAKDAGADLGQLQQLGEGDPTKALAYLRTAGDFQAAGTEQVRGVETTHYSGSLDLSKALHEVEGADREQLQALLDRSGVTSIPADAWIDGDGYLRKLVLDYSGLGGTSGGGVKIAMELYDFGTDVQLDLPAGDEVTDITGLAAKGGLGS